MDAETFWLTEIHLRLAREMYVSWDGTEFGAPAIDPKRPYGNGDVLGDMREMMSEPDAWSDDGLREIHSQMQTAIQIILNLAPKSALPGLYQREKYGGTWTLESLEGSP